MPSIRWDGSLETGHETVDAQHRDIIDLINEVVALQEADCDATKVAPVLVSLSDYVSTHFAEEEALMARCSYPGHLSDAHRQQHRQLSRRTRELVLAHREAQTDEVCDLVALMREWLTEHIMQVDQQLVDHIRRSAGPAQL